MVTALPSWRILTVECCGATWCRLHGEVWCNLVEIAAQGSTILHRFVRLAADYCSLMQLGTIWCNLVQICAKWCYLVQISGV